RTGLRLPTHTRGFTSCRYHGGTAMTHRSAYTRLAALAALAGAASCAAGQGQSVVYTPHNLSATSPGSVRASSEDQVCIFCHAPHHASRVQPLWNRANSTATYTIYRSDSLRSQPGQPTGASKMCLSCHDGTIALGSVVSRNQTIHMAGGITTMPQGNSN